MMTQSYARKVLIRFLRYLDKGTIIVYEKGREFYRQGHDNPVAIVDILDSRAWRAILQGSINVAEAYIEGWWHSPDLSTLITWFAQNTEAANRIDSNWRRWFRGIKQRLGWWQRYSRSRAQQNIASHYDSGNKFFSLFLDQQMTYSCAIYPDNDSTLDKAALNKLSIICQKLNLHKDDHLLDLGCGWGGLSRYAIKNYGCNVTAVTLSKAQYKYCLERSKKEGLSDKLNLVLSDYRDINASAKFNKMASIEMIEAVGAHNFYDYFRYCSRFLSDGGLFLLQAIHLPQPRYDIARKEIDFIQKYIFPGGALPSLPIMLDGGERHGLQLLQHEDITAHYVKTLNDWQHRLHVNKEPAHKNGVNEKMFRTWDYYFSYCASGFETRLILVSQLLYQQTCKREGL